MDHATEKLLRAMVDEMHEMNKKLDRLCRASILSIPDPEVYVKNLHIDESDANAQEKQSI